LTAATDLDILCYYAYSDLYEGPTVARTTLLGETICSPIRLLIGFPTSVEPQVPEVLTIEVLVEDPQLGSVPLADAFVEIEVFGGSVLAADGVTDTQGRFETEVMAAGGISPMRVVVRIRDDPDGPALVEGFVDTAVVTTTTTTSTLPAPSGTVTLREGTCTAHANVNGTAGSDLYNETDRQQDGPMPVSLSGSQSQGAGAAVGTSSASASATFDAVLLPATSTNGIGGFSVSASGSHQVQIVLIDSDALGSLTANATSNPGCTQEFAVSGQVAFSVSGSISLQGGNGVASTGGAVLAVQQANPPFQTFFADSVSDSGSITPSGGGILTSGQYKVTISGFNTSHAQKGIATDGEGNVSIEVQLVFSAPGATTTVTTTSVTSTSSSSSSSTLPTTTTSTSTTATTMVTTTTLPLPPGAGFDYRLHPSTGPDAPSVMLTDEFGSETVDLGTAAFHLAPTGIGGAFPVNPKSDVTCYGHSGAMFSGTATAVNRFSVELQELALTGPVATCVPRDDAVVEVDHFTCYGASGADVGAELSLFDRFQNEVVTVGAPTLYCTPTDKNGEGILVPPTPHVVCYDTTPAGAAPGTFEVVNQFHTAMLDLAAPSALCVSSFVDGASGS